MFRRKESALIGEEKLSELVLILESVGLVDPDYWGFRKAVRNADNYVDGVFEWIDRSTNLCYRLYAPAGAPIEKVVVDTLSATGKSLYDAPTVSQTNIRLQSLFSN